MKQIRFTKTGWIYIPGHPLGFIVTILAIIFMMPIVIAVDRAAHSITDELYHILFMQPVRPSVGNGWQIKHRSIQNDIS